MENPEPDVEREEGELQPQQEHEQQQQGGPELSQELATSGDTGATDGNDVIESNEAKEEEDGAEIPSLVPKLGPKPKIPLPYAETAGGGLSGGEDNPPSDESDTDDDEEPENFYEPAESFNTPGKPLPPPPRPTKTDSFKSSVKSVMAGEKPDESLLLSDSESDDDDGQSENIYIKHDPLEDEDDEYKINPYEEVSLSDLGMVLLGGDRSNSKATNNRSKVKSFIIPDMETANRLVSAASLSSTTNERTKQKGHRSSEMIPESREEEAFLESDTETDGSDYVEADPHDDMIYDNEEYVQNPSPTRMGTKKSSKSMVGTQDIYADSWLQNTDFSSPRCLRCARRFGRRKLKRHHCQCCGIAVCHSCSSERLSNHEELRVCSLCFQANQNGTTSVTTLRPVPVLVSAGVLTKSSPRMQSWAERLCLLDSNGIFTYFKEYDIKSFGDEPLPQMPLLTAWFRKKGYMGRELRRFCELHQEGIQYYVKESNLRGDVLKGMIEIRDTTELSLDKPNFAIILKTPSRNWHLRLDNKDTKVYEEWVSRIQEIIDGGGNDIYGEDEKNGQTINRQDVKIPSIGKVAGIINVAQECLKFQDGTGDKKWSPLKGEDDAGRAFRLDTAFRTYNLVAETKEAAVEWKGLVCLTASLCYGCGKRACRPHDVEPDLVRKGSVKRKRQLQSTTAILDKEDCIALNSVGRMYHPECFSCSKCPKMMFDYNMDSEQLIYQRFGASGAFLVEGELMCLQHATEAREEKNAEVVVGDWHRLSPHMCKNYIKQHTSESAPVTKRSHEDKDTIDDFMIDEGIRVKILTMVNSKEISVPEALSMIKAEILTEKAVKVLPSTAYCLVKAIGKPDGVNFRTRTGKDGAARAQIHVDSSGPWAAFDYEFAEIHKEHFRRIRDCRNIRSQELLSSFTEIPHAGNVLSGGASGCIVVTSRDHRFVMKGMRGNELKVLTSILESYVMHVMTNPDTLLACILGLYEVQLHGKTTTYILMENVLGGMKTKNVSINELYDLKGSVEGRRAVTGNGRNFKGTRKDMDFRRNILLSPRGSEIIRNQLKKDVDFLSSIEVMDYSLLVAIHDCKEKPCAECVDCGSWEFPDEFKTIRGHGTREGHEAVYAIGIIDFLQKWDRVKVSESLAKSKLLGKDKREISAVEPQKYSRRFFEFMDSRIKKAS